MAEREDQLRADLGLDGTAVVERRPQEGRVLPGRVLPGRAIKAAPGASRPAALPPSRTTPTPQIIASTPRQLEQRRGQHP
jgi:hypothetical protein